MAQASVTLYPMATTNAANSFGTSWDGGMQGMDMSDPSTRHWLSGGYLASTETLPMYGGVAICELLPTPTTATLATSGSSGGTPVWEMGPAITRATTVTAGAGAITGFSVFTQNYAGIITPSQEVPVVGAYQEVNFYRFGTNARIWVACDPTVTSLEGSVYNTAWSWDFAAQMLVPYSAAYAADTITNAVWSSTSGGQTSYTVSTDIHTIVAAGDYIDVSGVVNTGGASTGAFNGHWQVVSADATHVVVSAPAASSIGTYSSGGTIAAAGGTLGIRGVLKIAQGNSMVVSYNAATGLYSWNRSGSCALILL